MAFQQIREGLLCYFGGEALTLIGWLVWMQSLTRQRIDLHKRKKLCGGHSCPFLAGRRLKMRTTLDAGGCAGSLTHEDFRLGYPKKEQS